MKKPFFTLSIFLLLNFSDANASNTDFLQKDFRVTLEWLEQKPKSYAKDFFILQYLNQENLPFENAKIAYEMGNGTNATLKKVFNEKYNKKAPIDLKCYRATIEQLKQEDSKCIALGLSLQEATQISKKDLEYFISQLDPYPTLKNDLKIIASNDPFSSLIKSDMNRFFRLFFDLGENYRVKFFNKSFSPQLINEIYKDKNFEKFLRYVIYNKKLSNIQKSLFILKDNKTLAPHISFLLGINAINNNNLDVANSFFLDSYKKSYLRTDKDKSLFWLYLVNNDQSFLQELSNSWDNSIYTLYAKELLNLESNNIVYDVKIKNKKSNFDIHDAFKWMEVVSDTKKNLDENKLKKYEEIFSDKNTIPHLAYILERYNKYKTQYFITPYRDIVGKYDIYKQVLIYSIARQESHFIPSSISFSSAQGVMQIMPFLSLDISKKLNEEYNIYEQFIPNKNIKYGSFHLDTLMKQFDNNPLFIAYAYNGGAGYTRTQLKKGLFKEKNKFEPFLSMEMISYSETREYGKKVLANYHIYNNYLNSENKVSLSTIFQSLVSPY
ncbi:lytic transglycosylase domain-containing protein [Arcobacter aquimarinus]|uniref:Soluble lytic murein transglycosylase n=1 Tax=Arcobacter aquimarinus TaxID=1315211 RepID=A0AAE7B3X8_9BACT|nr:lytic transglycosylase domain-containing protein [Arcobacter aquimarinus]QKE26031.1 soluble lytic murein transglycosylase [Arcobacter aquimarinus]RXI36601.1 lytic murein transglycosylase [Arcobacter aquimarinus]